MKYSLFVLLILGLGFASCSKEPQPMTKAQVQQKIDSMTKLREVESDAQAKQDLERRIKIEVRVKADSIAYALQHKTAKDTVKGPPGMLKAPMGPPMMTMGVPKTPVKHQ